MIDQDTLERMIDQDRTDPYVYVRRMAEVLAEAIDDGYVPSVLVAEVVETERRMRERAAVREAGLDSNANAMRYRPAARAGGGGPFKESTPADRWYRGELIQRAGPNASGIRWYALVDCTGLRADTLRGIKHLIRERLEAS